MRYREHLVILSAGLTLSGGLLGASPIVAFGASLTLLLTAWQLVRDGMRWTMVPAYGLTGLALFSWYAVLVGAPARTVGLPTTILFAGTLLAAIAVLILFPAAPFPAPTGPFAIGTLTYHWIDSTRTEIFSDQPGARRELMVQLWYPAVPQPHRPRAPYLADATVLTSAFARLHHQSVWLMSHLHALTSHAVPAAPPLPSHSPYPVLLFLEGATGFRQMNTIQIEALVSHGFVVVGLDQPYTAATVVFPDGRQVAGLAGDDIHALVRPGYLATDPPATLHGHPLPERSILPYLAQDVSFVIDQLHAIHQADPYELLTGHFDLDRIGAFGVSLGGIVVTEACLRDPRVRAGLSMDAAVPLEVVQAQLPTPMLWVSRDPATMRLERQRAGGWSEEEIEVHQTSMRQAFDHCVTTAYIGEVEGLFHANLTDIPCWSPLITWLGFAGPIGGQRAWRIINTITVAFFQSHLGVCPAAVAPSIRPIAGIRLSIHHAHQNQERVSR